MMKFETTEEILVGAKALCESAELDPLRIFKEYKEVWKEYCKVVSLSEEILGKSLKEKQKYRSLCEAQLKSIPELGKKLLIMITAYDLCKKVNGGTSYGHAENSVVHCCWHEFDVLEGNFLYYLDLIDGKPLQPDKYQR